MKKKFSKHPELNKKRIHREFRPLATPETAIAIQKEKTDDEWASILQLCDEYDVQLNDEMWMNLALALAKDFVPAFQPKTRRRPKTKWSDLRRGLLVVEIERIVETKSTSVEAAAKELASHEPWSSFLQTREKGELAESSPDPGEALRVTYYNSNRGKLANTSRKAFKWDQHSGNLDAWDALVRDSLEE